MHHDRTEPIRLCLPWKKEALLEVELGDDLRIAAYVAIQGQEKQRRSTFKGCSLSHMPWTIGALGRTSWKVFEVHVLVAVVGLEQGFYRHLLILCDLQLQFSVQDRCLAACPATAAEEFVRCLHVEEGAVLVWQRRWVVKLRFLQGRAEMAKGFTAVVLVVAREVAFGPYVPCEHCLCLVGLWVDAVGDLLEVSAEVAEGATAFGVQEFAVRVMGGGPGADGGHVC